MYDLPEEELEFLNSNFNDKWERVAEGNKRGLIIHSYGLPQGYTPNEVNLMLLIPTDYPAGQLDMFYFSPGVSISPEISRRDKFAIGGLSFETHFGTQWQRWSRHYTWRPGEDNIVTHVSYVRNELKSELRKAM